MAWRDDPLMATNWAKLFGLACDLIDQVNSEAPIIDEWTLGGGTALMLQLGHRQSHDIDIFVEDGQILGYLDPAKADLRFGVLPSSYSGDGNTFRKFAFRNLGEIDFIVGLQLTSQPYHETVIEARSVLLETVGEIIAKKVFYRGSSIAPRDIFDIAAAASRCPSDIDEALSNFPDRVKSAINAIERENGDYINAVIDDLQITDEFESLKGSAIDMALDVLRSALPKHP